MMHRPNPSSRGGDSNYGRSDDARRNGHGGPSGGRGGRTGPSRFDSGGFGGGQRRQQNNQTDDLNLKKPVWNQSNLIEFQKEFYRETSAIRNRSPNLLNEFMNEFNVQVAGNKFVKPLLQFNEIDLPEALFAKFRDNRYEKPTPIQSMCWPTLMSGNDLVGIAQTGSGKTLGFTIPIIVHIMNNQRYLRAVNSNRDDLPGPIALVLAPTRELALQIQEVAEEFGSTSNIRNLVVYGGASKGPQSQQIRRGAEICIATPGRLLDFLKEGTISLHRCTFLVLDEADRMLDMGFEPQIRKIIEQIRPDRQTAMFSATWPKEVRKLAEDFIHNYMHISIGSADLQANPNIRQIVEVCQDYQKEARLKEILSEIMRNRDAKVILFAETKKKVDMYSKFIRDLGFHCLAIHGDKKQSEREWVLGEFKKRPRSILCATDVAARGINIEDIKFVINIDYPNQTEDYIHRIGRTARSSNTGTAFTFVTNDNSRHVPKLIEVLREANQVVSDELMGLCGGRGGFRGKFQPRGGHQNGNSNGYSNESRSRFQNGSDYGSANHQNGFGNHQNGHGPDDRMNRKRDASVMMNGHANGHAADGNSLKSLMDANGSASSSNRPKKFRWDEPNESAGSSHQPSHLMPQSVRPNPTSPANGYSNGHSGSRHSSSSASGGMYGPYPVKTGAAPPPPPPNSSYPSNGHHHPPPPPPPQQPSNGSQSSASSSSSNKTAATPPVGYPSSDYSSLYPIQPHQYYQQIAAAAAASGAGWQTAYQQWTPAPAK